MRKNKNKNISLKQLKKDLKKVTGKRTSKFGSFRSSLQNNLRKHGKTIAVIGGTTLAVAGTAAAMHYRNEIQNKEEQFHARELEAKATIDQIKRTQEADKKLLDAEKETAKKFDSKNKELEQLAKEKEQLRKEERAGNTIQVAYLKNQMKDRTKSLQDKEAALQQAIANQKIAFKINVAEQTEKKNDFRGIVTAKGQEVKINKRLTRATINSMKTKSPYKEFLEIIFYIKEDISGYPIHISPYQLYIGLSKFKYGHDIVELLKNRKREQVVVLNNDKPTDVFIVMDLLEGGGFNIQYDGGNTSSIELDEEIQFINYYNKQINEILHIN
jgi:hypothetical protein